MKVEPVRGPKFAAIVKKYGVAQPKFATPVLQGHESNDPLAIMLSNYLLWESTPALAEEALARVARVVVDVNDLRVMLEREVEETIGEKYPFVQERAFRLRATMNDIYRRHHKVSIDHLRNASRKDQRAYLEGLSDIPPFVAGRTLLVAFELPSAIADDTMVELLCQQGIVESTATTADVVQWIAKSHRVEELPKVYYALSQMSVEAWNAAGKNATKIRGAYLARHASFRAVEVAERKRVEDEKLAKVRDAERVAENKRLAEIAREEDRLRQKREGEEARVRAKIERDSQRVAAIAERQRKLVQREIERVAREKQQVKEAAARAKEAEKQRIRKEASDRKAAILREKREKKAADTKKQLEKKLAERKLRDARAASQKAEAAARKKLAQATQAAKKAAVKAKAAKSKVATTKVATTKAAKTKVAKSKVVKSKVVKSKVVKTKAGIAKAGKSVATKSKTSKSKPSKSKPSKSKTVQPKVSKSKPSKSKTAKPKISNAKTSKPKPSSKTAKSRR